MAKAQPLVRGFLERISVTAFEKYYREIAELVQSQHGVYALYKDRHLYYVGLAIDLRRRIKQHLRDKHADRWNRFSLYLVRKVDHIKEIESLLLRIADPDGNKQGGRLRRAKNLDRELRRMMQERQQDELDEIFARESRARRAVPRGTRKRGAKRKPAREDARLDYPLKGLVKGGKRIYATYKGVEYTAIVYGSGRIKFRGQFYGTPTAAAKAIRKLPTNGWAFWRIRKDGELVKLSELRKLAER